ncbi:MAG: DM13 domain-containing protein [Cyanobacteria bacterium P01_G01_bin.38]
MNFNLLIKSVFLGTLSGVLIALAAPTHVSMAQATEVPVLPQSGQLVAAKSGIFVTAEAPTTGTATLVEEDGQHYLEIDEAFSTTDQAPDLQVLLDPAAVPPATYETFNGYINLGSLQAVSGAQRYPIPEAIDLAAYQSVVIWCRTANATMGYAPLD